MEGRRAIDSAYRPIPNSMPRRTLLHHGLFYHFILHLQPSFLYVIFYFYPRWSRRVVCDDRSRRRMRYTNILINLCVKPFLFAFNSKLNLKKLIVEQRRSAHSNFHRLSNNEKKRKGKEREMMMMTFTEILNNKIIKRSRKSSN